MRRLTEKKVEKMVLGGSEGETRNLTIIQKALGKSGGQCCTVLNLSPKKGKKNQSWGMHKGSVV